MHLKIKHLSEEEVIERLEGRRMQHSLSIRYTTPYQKVQKRDNAEEILKKMNKVYTMI